jgi:hypothetical protein
MDSTQPVRRFRRYRTDFRVKLHFTADGQTQSITARTYEMSPGGLSVYAPTEIPSDAEVTLDLVLPGDQHSMRVGAQIRNRLGFRYGMEFQPLTKEQENRLRSFCSDLA